MQSHSGTSQNISFVKAAQEQKADVAKTMKQNKTTRKQKEIK